LGEKSYDIIKALLKKKSWLLLLYFLFFLGDIWEHGRKKKVGASHKQKEEDEKQKN
jgi:hypothetical protein